MSTHTSPVLPLEIWFQILNQTLNDLLPVSTTPRTFSMNIVPLLLTSRTFHDCCHPVTYPHLRKHKLLQLFTRWKAAHSREVHFYHHPLRNHVRYALPDRVGNPPGEEYEALYGFIKREYLFGCESVCGTVIPVEGGLEAPVMVPSAVSAPPAAAAAMGGGQGQGNENHGAATGTLNHSTPGATTGNGVNGGNVVIAPPPAQAAAPVVTHHGGEGGGQSWKNHALQWHVANPTFAAEGTIELYRDVVEEYRRMVCGTAAAREKRREIERAMDMMRNPQRYAAAEPPRYSKHPHPSTSTSTAASRGLRQQQQQQQPQQEADEDDLLGAETEDEMDDTADDEDEDEQEIDMTEIEAKGGLRRRDSGHGQSSSEMEIDEDMDDEDENDMMTMELSRSRSTKRELQAMSMDYQLEDGSSSSSINSSS
ncbi:hypothetical protein BGX31_003326, partial [Mortierella sp. GBA43]